MCLQRGWEESHGPAPTRREAEGELGAKLPYKGSRGRGGGAFPADPHRPRTRWSGERGHAISGRLHPVVELRRKQLERRHPCKHSRSAINTAMSKHSRSDGAHCACEAEHDRFAGKKTTWNEGGLTLKAAQARTRRAIPRQCLRAL